MCDPSINPGLSPNGSAGWKCGQMYTNGKWDDTDCSIKQPFVCEVRFSSKIEQIERCPAGYKFFEDKCYKYDKIDKRSGNFDSMNEYCEGEGGKLVEPRSKRENEFVKRFIKSKVNPVSDDQKNVCFFTGLTDRASEGKFKWLSDSTSPKFTDWYINEPNNAGNQEDCMVYHGFAGFEWNDFSCGEACQSLCEMDAAISENESPCISGWQQIGSRCFQINFDSETRKAAETICSQMETEGEMGANLADKIDMEIFSSMKHYNLLQGAIWIGGDSCTQFSDQGASVQSCDDTKPSMCAYTFSTPNPTPKPTLSPTFVPTVSPTSICNGFNFVEYEPCECGYSRPTPLDECTNSSLSRVEIANLYSSCFPGVGYRKIWECVNPFTLSPLQEEDLINVNQRLSVIESLNYQSGIFPVEEAVHVDYFKKLSEGICSSNPCPCGRFGHNCEGKATTAIERLELARALANCEFFKTNNTQGVFILLGLTCLHETQLEVNFDSHATTFHNVVAEIGSLLHILLLQSEKNKDESFAFIDSIGKFLRSFLLSNTVLRNKFIPVFTTEFSEQEGSSRELGISQFGNYIHAFISNYETIQREQKLFKYLDGGFQSIEDSISETAKLAFEGLKKDSLAHLDAFDSNIRKGQLTIEQGFQVTSYSNKKLQGYIQYLQEESLPAIGKASNDYIDAVVALEKKQIEIERRKLLISIIITGLECAAAVFSAGASLAGSLSAKAGTIGAKMLTGLKFAASKTSDLLDYSANAFSKVAGSADKSSPDETNVAETLFGMVGSIQKYRKASERLKQVDKDADKARGTVAYGLQQTRLKIDDLVTKATIMAHLLLEASTWIGNEQNVQIDATRVDPSLFVPEGSWEDLQFQIMDTLTVQTKLCPQDGATNPYENNQRLLSISRFSSTMESRRTLSGTFRAFSRTLGSKDTDEETQRAKDTWDSLAFECGKFQQDLQNVVNWGKTTQTNIFSMIESFRQQIVVFDQQKALQSSVDNWDKLIQKADQRSVENHLPIDERSRILKLHFDSILWMQTMAMEMRAVNLISSLCNSFYYDDPQHNLPSVDDDFLKVHDDCSVSIVASNDPVTSSMDRLKLLRDAMGSDISEGNQELYKQWKLDYLEKKQPTEVVSASCDISQNDLLGSIISGLETSFEINLASLNSGFGNCFLNAEIAKFKIIFLDEKGETVPKQASDGFVDVRIESDQTTTYYKYTKTGTTNAIKEIPFRALSKRSFKYRYYGMGEKDFCPIPLHQDGSICQSVTVEDTDYLMKMPVFGTWRMTLVGGWPSGLGLPHSLRIYTEIQLGEDCDEKEIKLENVIFSSNRFANEISSKNMQFGSVCGGKEFPTGETQSKSITSSPTSSPTTSLPTGANGENDNKQNIAIPLASVGATLVLGGVGFFVWRRRKLANNGKQRSNTNCTDLTTYSMDDPDIPSNHETTQEEQQQVQNHETTQEEQVQINMN